jgi:hypothetical protein
MKLTTSTSEHRKGETKFHFSNSKQLTISYCTVTDLIEIFRNEKCLQFVANLRPAYMAGFNNSISDAAIAPIPSEFAGGNDKTRAYCFGAIDASSCVQICSNNRLFSKSLKSVC